MASFIANALTWYAKIAGRRYPKPPFKHIVQIGDPILRRQCSPVDTFNKYSPKVNATVDILKKVIKKYECYALTASQIGVNMRIFVMQLNDKQKSLFSKEEILDKEIQEFPMTVFINPQMKIIDYNKKIFYEGCESIRGFEALVPRYNEISITAHNENDELFTINLKGWLARIVQHEMDHLNGKLYTDIMVKESFRCTSWENVNRYEGKVYLSYTP